MRRVLWALGASLAVSVVALVVVGVVVRHSDGPLGPFPGGELSGEEVSEPVSDWSPLTDRDTLELQVGGDDPRSVTVWLLVRNGRLYIPSALPKRKTWPSLALEDPRVVVRLEGRLHPGRAVRVADPQLQAALSDELAAKYGTHPGDDSEAGIWYFRLDPD